MRRLYILFIISVALLTQQQALAQSQEKLYSLLVVNFARGIHWPGNSADVFTIGIIEYPPLVDELTTTTANLTIHGKKIRVVPIVDVNEAKRCQIVFLPSYKNRLFSKLLASVPDSPTLLVSNKSDNVKNGGDIDLVLRNGKLTFDINCRSIEKRGLKISSAIKGAGNIVQ